MEHYRFFEEYRDDDLRTSTGNVIAVQITEGPFVQDGAVTVKAVRALNETPTSNGEVAMAFLNAEYLGTHCRHIDPADARALHPRLFDYIERLA